MIRRRDAIRAPIVVNQPQTSAQGAAAAVPDQSLVVPALALVMAAGVFLVAAADTAARNGVWWAELSFWAGLLIMFLPTGIRLFSRTSSRQERVALVVLLGFALYLAKVVYDPTQFTAFDEFSNWRTTSDVLISHRLFQPNDILRVNPLFPGLGIITSALAAVSGMSIFHAGLVTIGAARLIMVLSLFLLYEQIGGSPRLAAIGTLLYMANPDFLFFDAQFAYESLGLPLALFASYAAIRREWLPVGRRRGMAGLSLVAIVAVVTTHHITTLVLIAFFALWTLATIVARTRRRGWTWPLGLTAFVIVAGLAWVIYIAAPVIHYLGAPLADDIRGTIRLLQHEQAPRQIATSATGRVAAAWERYVAEGSILCILIALPFGLWQVLRAWQVSSKHPVLLVVKGRDLWGHRSLAPVVALGAAAFAYPCSLLLRLTPQGTETSRRSSEFLFVGVAFVLATAATRGWISERRAPTPKLGYIVFAVWCGTIFTGGVLLDRSPTTRLPGSYIVGGDERSINQESVASAKWARGFLGTHNRILTDWTNRQLMGAYGEQAPLGGTFNGVNVGTLFLTPSIGPRVRRVLRGDAIRYIVVDHRLADALPEIGIYFDDGEPGAGHHQHPIPAWLLNKFNALSKVSEVYSSGSIVMYDVGALTGCSPVVKVHDRCSPLPPQKPGIRHPLGVNLSVNPARIHL